MISGYKPDFIWLDEIAEAVRNATTALDNSITHIKYLMPMKAQGFANKVTGEHNYLIFLSGCLRELCTTLGSISCRLIQTNSEPDASLDKVRKLNIL